MRSPHKGRFSPKNPQKYNGDPTAIVYRSAMELRLMKYLDENTNVIEWQSDVVEKNKDGKPNGFAVPYRSPIDNRIHRYYPDMIAKVRNPDGAERILMIEVKPESQTKEPKKPKKRTRRYIEEVVTWGINQAKWKSARELCEHHGWEFKLITEKELGISYK